MGHLLLALIEEHDSAVEAFFAERGVAPAELLADVRRSLGTGDDRLWDGILVTPRVRGVVSRAESCVALDEPVEPLHVLAEMLAEEAGLASDLVARHTGNSRPSGRVGG